MTPFFGSTLRLVLFICVLGSRFSSAGTPETHSHYSIRNKDGAKLNILNDVLTWRFHSTINGDLQTSTIGGGFSIRVLGLTSGNRHFLSANGDGKSVLLSPNQAGWETFEIKADGIYSTIKSKQGNFLCFSMNEGLHQEKEKGQECLFLLKKVTQPYSVDIDYAYFIKNAADGYFSGQEIVEGINIKNSQTKPLFYFRDLGEKDGLFAIQDHNFNYLNASDDKKSIGLAGHISDWEKIRVMPHGTANVELKTFHGTCIGYGQNKKLEQKREGDPSCELTLVPSLHEPIFFRKGSNFNGFNYVKISAGIENASFLGTEEVTDILEANETLLVNTPINISSKLVLKIFGFTNVFDPPDNDFSNMEKDDVNISDMEKNFSNQASARLKHHVEGWKPRAEYYSRVKNWKIGIKPIANMLIWNGFKSIPDKITSNKSILQAAQTLAHLRDHPELLEKFLEGEGDKKVGDLKAALQRLENMKINPNTYIFPPILLPSPRENLDENYGPFVKDENAKYYLPYGVDDGNTRLISLALEGYRYAVVLFGE